MLKPSFISDEYLVSDEGYVLSKDKTHKLKPAKNPNGYYILNLYDKGKCTGVALHKLVAMAFCDGYKHGLTVNHKDGNKENNCASNLEWVTKYENNRHAIEVLGYDKSGAKNINAKSIKAFDKKTGEFKHEFPSLIEASKFLNPSYSYKQHRHVVSIISQVANGKNNRKSYAGYKWAYCD